MPQDGTEVDDNLFRGMIACNLTEAWGKRLNCVRKKEDTPNNEEQTIPKCWTLTKDMRTYCSSDREKKDTVVSLGVLFN